MIILQLRVRVWEDRDFFWEIDLGSARCRIPHLLNAALDLIWKKLIPNYMEIRLNRDLINKAGNPNIKFLV